MSGRNLKQNHCKGGLAIIHCGRRLPKFLRDQGYVEATAMHIGNDVWFIRCKKVESTSSEQKEEH